MPDTLRAFGPRESGRRNFLKGILGGFAAWGIPAGLRNSAFSRNLVRLDERRFERGASDGVYWEHVAGQYMFEPGLIMMNNGRAGAMPRPVFDTLAEYFEIQARNPYRCYTHFDGYREEARLSAARIHRSGP